MNYSNSMKALSAAIAIAGFAAAPAFAQYSPPTQDQASQSATTPRQSTTGASSSQAAFAQLDADHDGKIGKDEAAADAGLGAAFGSLDADGNGSLDQAEFDKYAQASQQGTSDGTTTPPSGSR